VPQLWKFCIHGEEGQGLRWPVQRSCSRSARGTPCGRPDHDDKSITLTVTPQRADAERLVIFFQNVETVRLVIEELQKEG